jgi:hypothetical protein
MCLVRERPLRHFSFSLTTLCWVYVYVRYFLNFFVDCTLGVAIVYLVHEGLCHLGTRFFGPECALARVGFYGNPPQTDAWLKQLGVYLVSLAVNKLIVLCLFLMSLSALENFGNWLFGPLQPHPTAELIVVMVLCPWILTTVQFLIFDAILKEDSTQRSISEQEVEDEYLTLGPEKSSTNL